MSGIRLESQQQRKTIETVVEGILCNTVMSSDRLKGSREAN